MARRAKVYRPPHAPTRAQRDRAFDRTRGHSAARLYDRRWRKARASYLAQHPLCVAYGCGQLANEVDHKVPHRGNRELFWDRGNWQPLCKSCHSAKTAREGGWGGSQSLQVQPR